MRKMILSENEYQTLEAMLSFNEVLKNDDSILELVNKIKNMFNNDYIYYINGVIYADTEDINEDYIEDYNLLDDNMTDFITDEEQDAYEFSVREIERMVL